MHEIVGRKALAILNALEKEGKMTQEEDEKEFEEEWKKSKPKLYQPWLMRIFRKWCKHYFLTSRRLLREKRGEE